MKRATPKKPLTYHQVLARLNALADPNAVEGMARVGISAAKALGVSLPNLRTLAKQIGTDHTLAQRLWQAATRETRILAAMIADPAALTEKQMEAWVADFEDWEVCDQCCMNRFDKTPVAYRKALQWSARDEQFVRRAGLALMARLAWRDDQAPDDQFEKFLRIIRRHAGDERNFVKKALSWALRQIGKRNPALNKKAVETAQAIAQMEQKSAKWVAADALRELRSPAVRSRLSKPSKR